MKDNQYLAAFLSYFSCTWLQKTRQVHDNQVSDMNVAGMRHALIGIRHAGLSGLMDAGLLGIGRAWLECKVRLLKILDMTKSQVSMILRYLESVHHSEASQVCTRDWFSLDRCAMCMCACVHDCLKRGRKFTPPFVFVLHAKQWACSSQVEIRKLRNLTYKLWLDPVTGSLAFCEKRSPLKNNVVLFIYKKGEVFRE